MSRKYKSFIDLMKTVSNDFSKATDILTNENIFATEKLNRMRSLIFDLRILNKRLINKYLILGTDSSKYYICRINEIKCMSSRHGSCIDYKFDLLMMGMTSDRCRYKYTGELNRVKLGLHELSKYKEYELTGTVPDELRSTMIMLGIKFIENDTDN